MMDTTSWALLVTFAWRCLRKDITIAVAITINIIPKPLSCQLFYLFSYGLPGKRVPSLANGHKKSVATDSVETLFYLI
jgi:hypothetical protein